ncbi:MAG: DUF4142 domain-containing protein [Dokdonella sp.]
MKSLMVGIAIALAGATAAQATDAGNDQSFVTQVGQGGAAEVELGKTAQMQGMRDAVKQFGKQMVTDHTAAGEALARAAKADGLTVPAAPSASQKATGDQMKAMKGTAFDDAYATAMVKDHKETIALFETEATSGQSANVKAFAEKTLPTLRAHLKMAEGLSASK